MTTKEEPHARSSAIGKLVETISGEKLSETFYVALVTRGLFAFNSIALSPGAMYTWWI